MLLEYGATDMQILLKPSELVSSMDLKEKRMFYWLHVIKHMPSLLVYLICIFSFLFLVMDCLPLLSLTLVSITITFCLIKRLSATYHDFKWLKILNYCFTWKLLRSDETFLYIKTNRTFSWMVQLRKSTIASS